MVNSIVCALLFLFFSFTYLYNVQGETIQQVHSVLSEGKTSYSLFWGAFITTIVLWLICWGLNFITQFKGRWKAVSYFPAFMILVILSSFYPTPGEASFRLTLGEGWWWCIPATILYAVLATLYHRIERRESKIKLAELMIPNVLTMMGFIYLTGSISNNNEVFHNEIKVAHAIQRKDYRTALETGFTSPHSSQTLTALRALALSCTDSLGQHLFSYIQKDGAEGLFMDEEKGKTSIITNDSIYQHLGGISRKNNEPAVNYLHRVCESDLASSRALDYYLCSLLLERQLTRFSQVLTNLYDEDRPLPRHYQEALMLIRDKDATDSFTTEGLDSLNMKRYDEFKSLQQSYREEELRSNYTRRKFGNTYWWYFWYGE